MRKKGNVWILLGLLLLAAALALTVWNMGRANEAGDQAAAIVEELTAQIYQHREQEAEEGPTAETLDPDLPDYVRFPNMEMPTTKIRGYDYIGVLEIPALRLELPIMSTWDYTRLRIAPCRYGGSAYQHNMILCAHNYASHFGQIKSLSPGDNVTFTDVDGNVFFYRVIEIETLLPTAVEEMEAGDWDLTLFTCTIGGSTRVTVRCEMIE